MSRLVIHAVGIINSWDVEQALQAICGHNVGKNMVTVVRGLAKVYVGEIVETGEHCTADSLLAS